MRRSEAVLGASEKLQMPDAPALNIWNLRVNMKAQAVKVLLFCAVLSFQAEAADLVASTDSYMSDKRSRIVEIRTMCEPLSRQAEGSAGGQLRQIACSYDTGHTTGFNAVTQSSRMYADIRAVQPLEYSLETNSELSADALACLRKFGFPKGGAYIGNEVAYCVTMKGYERGKKFGYQYVQKKLSQ